VGVSCRKRVAWAAAGTARVIRCLSMLATLHVSASTGGSAARTASSACNNCCAVASTLEPVSSCTSHCKAWAAGRLPVPPLFLRVLWMRVLEVINPERPDMVSTKSHSSAKYLRIICVSAAAGVALVVSAAAGAWMQSQFHDRASAAAYVDGLAEEARGDAEYIRQNVAMLAAKVGSLQAKVAGLEGLGRRVAETAGLAYTDPEIQAALEQSFLDVNADVAAAATAAWTAESLGRELDHLE